MRSTSKSLAGQFGITNKNPSSGIGLNPNLNIEDEYIENLLKQIHFLAMEIKLVKEKQSQNKGLGIMGLLNKDQNPVVSHAITSNAKFVQMKNKLEETVNNATAQYLRLDDENYALKAQKDYLQKLNLKQQQKNIENKIYVEKEITDGIEKLKDNQKKLQELREQNGKLKDIHKKLSQQWDKSKMADRTKKLINQINNNLNGQIQNQKQKHLNDNLNVLTFNNVKLQQANKMYLNDPSYIEQVQENALLKQSLKRTDKELFDLNYKVKEKQQLKKLSIRNKDIQNQLKKQAQEEAQRTKKKLTDKQNQLQIKCKQAKLALQSQDDIKLLKGKINRKDRQIMELKKKTQASENNYKRLRQEVMKLQIQLKDKKQFNKQKQQKLNQLISQSNLTDTELKKSQLDYEKVLSDLLSLQDQLRQVRKRLENYQQQLTYLTAKQQHLEEQVNVQEEMKKIKIEQLTTLAQSNSGLNNTITDIMERWQQIIKFSRDSPI